MNPASAVVVDVSVALKSAFDNEDSVAAVALRDGAISGAFEMLAPLTLLYGLGKRDCDRVRRA